VYLNQTSTRARQTHDCVRHGTTSVFAVLEMASNRIHARCFRRRRHLEFVAFRSSLAHRYAERELHLICDKLGTHKHRTVKQRLATHPRIHLHFTRTGAS